MGLLPLLPLLLPAVVGVVAAVAGCVAACCVWLADCCRPHVRASAILLELRRSCLFIFEHCEAVAPSCFFIFEHCEAVDVDILQHHVFHLRAPRLPPPPPPLSL